MTLPHFYTGQLDRVLATGRLESETIQHIKALRLRSGHEFILFNGHGRQARIRLADEKKGTVKAVESLPRAAAEHDLPYIGVPLIKKKRLDYLIEKCTEQGCAGFTFFKSRFCQPFSLNRQHLTAVMARAAEQSGRFFLPRLIGADKVPDFSDWLTCLEKSSRPLYYGQAGAPALAQPAGPAGRRAVLLVGPEGGFSDDELSRLAQIGRGASLSRAILRSETAALSLLAQYHSVSQITG